jgi:hypothetical protein
MKKTFLAILVLIMVVSIPAAAQYSDGFFKGANLSVKAGWAWPQGSDLTETVENNWIVGGDFNYFFTRNFGVGVDFRYASKAVTSTIEEIDAEITWASMPISFNGVFRTKVGSSTVYFGAGVSMIQTTYGATLAFGELSFGEEQSVWAYGVDALVGLEIRKFFLEAQVIVGEADFTDLLLMEEEAGTMDAGLVSVVAGYRF